MGTSRNDPSPNTRPWRLVHAILGRQETPEYRQAQQIWRAALADRPDRLIPSFADPTVFAASQIAGERLTPRSAAERFDHVIERTGSASLAIDMARRALARTAAKGEGAATFAVELFAEATGYYAARDMPSVVGAEGRIATAQEAIRLKSAIQDAARTRVIRIGVPAGDLGGWSDYVASVVRRLAGQA